MVYFNPIFLIAVPQLLDSNFKRSVILILQHNHEGALGLVINEAININLFDFSQNQGWPCHIHMRQRKVFTGGPVETSRGWLLHGISTIKEKQQIVPGLYLSGSHESLRYVLNHDPQPFRFVLGCAGWAPGQLEAEMEQGSWVATQVEPRYVFYPNPLDIWDGILHDLDVNPATLAHGTGLH